MDKKVDKKVDISRDKKSVEIEKLLQWAYLDELPKRTLSSAEGIWDRLSQYGSLGGVNPDPSPGAQRYAQFGLPHRDAELIEVAVGRLGRAPFNWNRDFDRVADELSALVTINDVRVGLRAPPEDPFHATIVAAHDGRGVSSRVRRHAARDVLLVNTVNVSALVITHAIKRSRPDWRTERMRCLPTPAEHGPLGKVIGTCRGKNRYTTGSYCPLRWEPSPVDVVLTRADYLMWHQALVALSQSLKLAEHVALPPEAPATPWIEGEKKRRSFSQPVIRSRPLPLKPQRPRAGPPLRKTRKIKERIA